MAWCALLAVMAMPAAGAKRLGASTSSARRAAQLEFVYSAVKGES